MRVGSDDDMRGLGVEPGDASKCAVVGLLSGSGENLRRCSRIRERNCELRAEVGWAACGGGGRLGGESFFGVYGLVER